MRPIEALTAAEQRLLDWLAAGRTNAQIGQCLSRSEKTVRNQLTRLYAKLHVASRAEAVAVYLRLSLVPHDSERNRDVRPIAIPGQVR